ncbi:MAG: ABC transporter substrate-binding protein [Acidimicrobiales bacterium]
MRPTSRPRAVMAAVAGLGLVAAACGSDNDTDATGDGDEAAAELDVTDFDSVLAAAEGQTVDWYMFGGDDDINDYVNGYVADELDALGITLNQVPVTDTVEAVDKVLGEVQAGRTDDGTVDMIWINGENFATGMQADLWFCGYPEELPNAEIVDFDNPTIANDFGLAVEGCESPWQQANSALVYNSDALGDDDVASVDALFEWAEENPGRFTYPAAPDFTGSMAVRTFLYATADGGAETFQGEFDAEAYEPEAEALWERLNALEPSLYQGGDTYPSAQTDVERLFGEGAIDAYLTYGPGSVASSVEDGTFPESTRTAVFEDGNIGNHSFVAIPANSPDIAAAIVLADLLLSPEAQLALFEATGGLPVFALDQVADDIRTAFEEGQDSPSLLAIDELTANPLPEPTAEYVTTIEEDWIANVLQQ